MMRETTLAANQWLEDARQMDWSTRYVYAGGDDGLLPEDNPDDNEDYKFNKHTDHKENEHYSEEEYAREKAKRQRDGEKGMSKIHNKYHDDRRKRSLDNITSSIIDNVTDVAIKPMTANNSLLGFEARTFPPIPKSGHSDITTTEVATKKKKERKLFIPKVKPSKFYMDLSKDSEESDEDLSSTMKKRSFRKKNGTKKVKPFKFTDSCTEDSDDGITKSIYEMYYKSKPRRGSFKPHIRSSEVTDSRRSKRVNDDYSDEVTTRKSKKRNRLRLPFFASDRRYDQDRIYRQRESKSKRQAKHNRGRREYLDYSQEEEVSSAAEDEETEGEDKYNRRKRDIQNDEQAERSAEVEPEQDYVITLRPTQIRTFVIWFKDKKPYTL